MPARSRCSSATPPIVEPEPGRRLITPSGRPGLLEQPHHVVRGEHRRRSGLPEHDVAHQCGRARQVAADRGEVERRHREHEALERPVLHAVPDAGRRDRLLGVDPRHVLDVEAEEVDQLARGVDLGLVRGLRLAEHRGRVERVAPRAGEQLGGAEEDGGAVLPRPARPVLPRRRGGVDRLLHVLGARLVDVGEDVLLVVRHHGRARVAGRDVLAADDHEGISMRSPAICARRFSSEARSALPGAKSFGGSLRAGGGRKCACVLSVAP